MKRKPLPQGFERECRSFAMPDIRADEGSGIIEGHAAVYGQEANIGGWFIEIIERGAFDKTDFRDVVFTANHNLEGIPFARSRNNNANSTLQLRIDEQGLYTRANLDIENNSEARALHSAVGRGDISGMSFIFAVRASGVFWEGLDTDLPIRRIKDVARVYEVSAVSFPAYTGTDIQTRDNLALESARAALESARSSLVSDQSELELWKAKLKLY